MHGRLRQDMSTFAYAATSPTALMMGRAFLCMVASVIRDEVTITSTNTYATLLVRRYVDGKVLEAGYEMTHAEGRKTDLNPEKAMRLATELVRRLDAQVL